MFSRKRNNRVFCPEKGIIEELNWRGCGAESGLLHPRRKVYYAETASQVCYVFSAVRKMYRPAGDERQATRRNGSGVSNSR